MYLHLLHLLTYLAYMISFLAISGNKLTSYNELHKTG